MAKPPADDEHSLGDQAGRDTVTAIRDELADITRRIAALRPVDESDAKHLGTVSADPALRVALAHVDAARETLAWVSIEVGRQGLSRSSAK